jgi:23S rRNA pseudouridine955/2504/2580 synthase
MFLHARQISFSHPENGKLIVIDAPIPSECDRFLKSLSKDKADKDYGIQKSKSK